MIQIKIYNKDFSEITAFNEGEFGGLEYKKGLNKIGDASFVLDISNSKVTEGSMQHYNRVQIVIDGVIEFTGLILQKNIDFNTVTVRCKELIYLLKKRVVEDNYNLSGQAGTAIETLLAYLNADDDTGIEFGGSDVTTTVNMTFNSQDAFSILDSVANSVLGQFYIDSSDNKLYFKADIGTDKSSSVVFRYNITQPQLANILRFQVDDNGEEIVTESFGKSDALTSVQDDATLKTKYGKLQVANNFAVANVQANLDGLTSFEISDSLFSPDISLSPTVADNFVVGDTVKVTINNKLVDIDDSFQVLEKNVRIVNKRKQISVKINKLPKDITTEVSKLQRKVKLLENNA